MRRGRQTTAETLRSARPGGGLAVVAAILWCAAAALADVRTSFTVKHVVPDAVYLDGGREAGLAEGQTLTVRRGEPERDIAELKIVAVASTSAVAEVASSSAEIVPGDVAWLSRADADRLAAAHAAGEARKYPQVITFTEGDPLDEEARERVPRPPLPEVNRARGRVALEYNSISDPRSNAASSQFGFVFRADMTRVGASHWNLSGYYRGRFTSRTGSADQHTLTDLINRTYHLSLTYNNPGSRWVAGFGRLYLPWATSLSTIDGGYVGRRAGRSTTFGLFGGSAPDPTSWRYDPNRQLAGSFVNFEGGSFESVRYTSTAGIALSRVHWHPDRQFGFFENGFFYRNYLSVYHNLEADLLRGPGNKLVLSRDFLTVRIQPHRIISFDLSENYFRDIPTFDARLVGTGLLDKLLFQGLSGGFRLGLPCKIGVYANFGRSRRTGDTRNSWNQMYGATLAGIWRTGIHADVRYSKFDSAFGSGTYRALFLTRDLGEKFRFELQAGLQDVVSPLTNESRARWVTAAMDWFISRHYFLGSGLTIYRGRVQSYDQWFLNAGYRF